MKIMCEMIMMINNSDKIDEIDKIKMTDEKDKTNSGERSAIAVQAFVFIAVYQSQSAIQATGIHRTS